MWSGLLAAALAHAQADWPSRPVTVVVPSSAGGGTDAYGRILAATAVAKAEPDGYTMLVASNSSLGISPVLYKTLTYNVMRDFAPVSRGVIAPMVVVAHPDAKVKALAELPERGRKEPAKLFYGTAGVGSPLYIDERMIEAASGARFSHVPYKGVAPAYTDLLGGHLQFMLTDLASVRPYIDAGKLVALAVTDKTMLLPTTPTLAEAVLRGIKAFTSFSVLLPARTPPALVKRVADEVAKAMRNPGAMQKLDQLALLPVFDTPEQFAASLKDEQQNGGTFIRARNITPD